MAICITCRDSGRGVVVAHFPAAVVRGKAKPSECYYCRNGLKHPLADRATAAGSEETDV